MAEYVAYQLAAVDKIGVAVVVPIIVVNGLQVVEVANQDAELAQLLARYFRVYFFAVGVVSGAVAYAGKRVPVGEPLDLAKVFLHVVFRCLETFRKVANFVIGLDLELHLHVAANQLVRCLCQVEDGPCDGIGHHCRYEREQD